MIYPITTKGMSVVDRDGDTVATAETPKYAQRIADCLNVCCNFPSPAKLLSEITELDDENKRLCSECGGLGSEIRDLKAAAAESDSEAHKRRIDLTVATTLRKSTELAFADAIRLVYTFNDALENLADAVAADLSVEDSEDVRRALTEARAILESYHE